MTVYSYAQLMGLWQQTAKGTKYASQQWAALMAAIAEAESGGNSDVQNRSGATGLWQILGDPAAGNPFDPATNAQFALDKLESQGLGAWTTYTSGAYKAYLNGETTPDTTYSGSPTATLTAATAQAAAKLSADCLVGWGGVSVGGLQNIFLGPLSSAFGDLPFGLGKGVSKGIKGGESYSNVGGFCLLSRSQARAMLGAAFLVGGGLVALPGLVLVAVGGAAKALSGPVQQVNRLPVVGSYTKAATGAAGRKFSYTPATAQAQT